MRFRFHFILILCLVVACNVQHDEAVKQFSKLAPESSNIDFENSLDFVKKFNIYTYRNFYNGGGVGIADINNDGWMDIYFTGNMRPNRLYLNNGDLTFTDITESAGVAGSKGWSTGVSMADINGDGWTDIYVCNSGKVDGDNKQNELFINQKDGTFVEAAADYGLDDQGYSTHAGFFDYDLDGDLDVYLLNNSFQAIGSFNLKKNERPIRNEEGGDKLFRNDNGKFVDVSEAAGIYGSVIGFGLGITIGDIDVDGWPDIFVSNDFFERDYIYMNNGDGTFRENLEDQMRSITGASMGADMADINNDGYPDIFVTEMLPEPNDRLKTKTTFENWDRYQYNLDNDYYHQFTRNMLHLNNGNETFSEIGRMAGVEATDWSWGALISDFDNDGYKDLFIANGIYKDLTDQDYINYISTEEMAQSVITTEGVDFQTLTDVIPSNKIPNYMYRNSGDYQFEKVTEDWGLEEPSHSNGSAYVDLDNDGDLDLVLNNSNAPATIYINNNEKKQHSNYLKVELRGTDSNSQAIGTRLVGHYNDHRVFAEQMPVKGFQSSVDPRVNMGLGSITQLDSLVIFWPGSGTTKMTDVISNQTLTIAQPPGKSELVENSNTNKIFNDVTQSVNVDFLHQENDFVDFDRDRLIYHMLSVEGPALCSADFNNDGRTDFYIGGAKDQSGQLYIQNHRGYIKANSSVFKADRLSEDVTCTCFDVDNDGDIDMYVASGGNEFPASSAALIDRLYLNNGSGVFSKSKQILPTFQFQNTGAVTAADYDGDGDKDLFVGARAKPFLIGVPADGFLLENDGTGNFKEVTKEKAPGLKKLGMITDASWVDIDGDDDQDLLIVGEWMSVKVFENVNGTLSNVSSTWGLDSTNGWWNKITASDLDSDGDIDFVLGNHGTNSRFQASRNQPVNMYINDFDQNGSAEAILCMYIGDESYPLALKHDLIAQLPSLKKKYVAYEAYKDEKITDIFPQEVIDKSELLSAYMLESALLINNGADGFEMRKLPQEAQFSPVFAISITDFDHDGVDDIVLGGNFHNAKPEVGRYDASYGTFLRGLGNAEFTFVPNREIGLNLQDQIRALVPIKIGDDEVLLVARNNQSLQALSY